MGKDERARVEHIERERWVQRKLRELREAVHRLPRYRQLRLFDVIDTPPDDTAPPPPRRDPRVH